MRAVISANRYFCAKFLKFSQTKEFVLRSLRNVSQKRIICRWITWMNSLELMNVPKSRSVSSSSTESIPKSSSYAKSIYFSSSYRLNSTVILRKIILIKIKYEKKQREKKEKQRKKKKKKMKKMDEQQRK